MTNYGEGLIHVLSVIAIFVAAGVTVGGIGGIGGIGGTEEVATSESDPGVDPTVSVDDYEERSSVLCWIELDVQPVENMTVVLNKSTEVAGENTSWAGFDANPGESLTVFVGENEVKSWTLSDECRPEEVS